MRGPKIKTAQNSTGGELIRHRRLDSPSQLTEAAKGEYDRLLSILSDKGTLDRLDLALVANCARFKVLVDRASAELDYYVDDKGADKLNKLTAQWRGLMRELGLTTAPNRSVVRTNPINSTSKPDAPASRIKLA